MLIKEMYPALIDTLGDLFPNLMGTSTLNHVQPCPSILSLRSTRSTDKEGVLELSLQIVLLDVVGEGGRHFSARAVSPIGLSNVILYILRVANTREARPANAGTIGEKVDEV